MGSHAWRDVPLIVSLRGSEQGGRPGCRALACRGRGLLPATSVRLCSHRLRQRKTGASYRLSLKNASALRTGRLSALLRIRKAGSWLKAQLWSQTGSVPTPALQSAGCVMRASDLTALCLSLPTSKMGVVIGLHRVVVKNMSVDGCGAPGIMPGPQSTLKRA